ncbi:unnamed protein product (macronuclear) [Paramecium tetraurelia]|uniref:Transmembrane protein n=1 Tax=Paramecium tetraurelia TaxID=5888 RepID=A0EAL4_PARTE|nr:uncharacterized protein GSPATT00025065001 [Paramecium tetraurelia]CAK92331.1 unnamed protein product [Paramecium tetraurelia]|eukprot:XP_001459728.1 hypothetical protein (macronuclear) [Paramecium tetraurelia strain d4-2]
MKYQISSFLILLLIAPSYSSCLKALSCQNEQSYEYQQFAVLQMMKCYYQMHNKSLHQNVESLSDHDWMIFTMFSNQFSLLCNYHSILNDINQITNSINGIKQQQEYDEQLVQQLTHNFKKMSQYSINFTSAIEVFQNTLKNEKVRLDKYNNISNHLSFIQNQTQLNQTTSFSNLNYLLQLTNSLQLISDNQMQDSIKFYLISSFALYLITRRSPLKEKQQIILAQVSILLLVECLISVVLTQLLVKYVRLLLSLYRFGAMLFIQYSIIKALLYSSQSENEISVVINQIKNKYRVE